MRVLYTGGTFCSLETFKRLVLLSDEIAFMDRPSISFGSHGTVGYKSEFRRFDTSGSPIQFSVHEPPSGFLNDLYSHYLNADLNNPLFLKTVIDGLKNDPIFQNRLIQLEANYGWGTGRQILNAILQDPTICAGDFSTEVDPKLLYVPDSPDGRKQTLGAMLTEASLHLTNALVTAENSNLSPVSDDPYFCRLLALRTSQAEYVRQPTLLSSILGLAVSKSVLPDEALSTLSIQDLFEFRRASIDSYEAWSIEVERLSLRLLDASADRISTETAKVIIDEVNPRMHQLRQELISARDKLFGDLIKTITKWEMPTLSIAYLTSLNLPSAIAAFVGALTPAVPSIVDYFVQRRELVRRNSLAYLVCLSKLADNERA